MGLLGSVAKTVVVAGTAQVSRNAVNRHAAKKNVAAYADARDAVSAERAQRVQPAAPATPPAQEDTISQLERLGALKDQGVLTEEEFQAQKAKILGT